MSVSSTSTHSVLVESASVQSSYSSSFSSVIFTMDAVFFVESFTVESAFALVCGFAGGGFRCRCSLCAVATVAYAGGGGLFAGRFAFQGLSAVLGRNPGRIYIGFVLLGENGGAEQCQKRQRQCKLGKFHKPNYNKKGPERCVFSKFNPEKFNEAAAAPPGH